ncbi:MAG: DNRLRE domain-containing protein, partial [Bacteroidota bacterium]
MKWLKVFSSLILFTFFVAEMYAQLQTDSLQPGPANGKDAHLSKTNPAMNIGNSPDFMALAWTSGSNSNEGQGIIEFDLTSIPSTAFVKNARLSLYQNTTTSSGNGGHSMSNGVNDAILARVTQPWSENSVSWNNQPATDEHQNVYLPQSNSSTEDYLDIDVSCFVRDWVLNPTSNHGLMMRLLNDSANKALIFASSDHPDPAKRPKLVVEYYDSMPSSLDTINIQLNAEDGFDAYMGYLNPNNNMGQQPDIMALAWTCSGTPCGGRGLFGFKLYWIPDTATIASAKLNLYQNYTSSNAGGNHSTLSGDNDSFIAKVTDPWDENTVTWNTAPAFTIENQIYLPPSTSAHQDYPDINVTNFVQYWHANPNKNYGMNLRLYTEEYYRSLIFASSEHNNMSLWPEMEVVFYYEQDTSSSSSVKYPEQSFTVDVFPNPAKSHVIIETDDMNNAIDRITMTNMQGQVLKTMDVNACRNIRMDTKDLSSGVYFINVYNDSGYKITKKVVIQ